MSVFDLNLSFDSALLDFESVDFGPLLGDIGSFEAIILADSLIALGVLNLAESSFLEENDGACTFCFPPYLQDIQGSGFTLATVTFQALTTGTGALSLAVNAMGDGSGFPLPVDSTGTASVTVSAPIAGPSPSAVLLLLAGLPLLRWFQRKQGFSHRSKT